MGNQEKKIEYGNDEYQGVKNSLSSIAKMIQEGESFRGDEQLQKALEIEGYRTKNEDSRAEVKRSITEHYGGKYKDEDFEKLLDKLNITDLSKDEKELYKSIIKDSWISDEEVENLSFEQLQTLNRFYNEADTNHTYISETYLPTDPRAGKLLHAAVATVDDAFNEAAYNILKSMKSDEEMAAFMGLVMGTNKGQGWESYFHDTATDHPTEPSKDPREVLEHLIVLATSGLKSAISDEEKEYYGNVLNVYFSLSAEYENNIQEQGTNYNGKKEFNIEVSKELLDEFSTLGQENLIPFHDKYYETILNDVNRLLEDTKKEKVYEKRIEWAVENIQKGIDTVDDNIAKTDDEEKSEKLVRMKEVLEKFQTSLEV